MPIFITEDRPSAFSNWGDSNTTPLVDIIEPPSGLQQATWQPGQKPPAPYQNWLEYITQRWIKNLDERAPRIQEYNYFIGDFSGAHYADLETCLAAISSGARILFVGSNSNLFLSNTITIPFKVEIDFLFTTFYKSNFALTRAIIINGDDVVLRGARFSSGWSGGSDACVEINGDRCRIQDFVFDENVTACFDETGVASDQYPELINNVVEYF
jgi:hypothetical protein